MTITLISIPSLKARVYLSMAVIVTLESWWLIFSMGIVSCQLSIIWLAWLDWKLMQDNIYHKFLDVLVTRKYALKFKKLRFAIWGYAFGSLIQISRRIHYSSFSTFKNLLTNLNLLFLKFLQKLFQRPLIQYYKHILRQRSILQWSGNLMCL